MLSAKELLKKLMTFGLFFFQLHSKLLETERQLGEAHGRLKEQRQLSSEKLMDKEQQVAELQLKLSRAEEEVGAFLQTLVSSGSDGSLWTLVVMLQFLKFVLAGISFDYYFFNLTEKLSKSAKMPFTLQIL